MPGSYTLELELFGTYVSAMPVLEIYEDGALDSSHSVSSSGTSISVTINYGGALPTSLSFTFLNDAAEAGRTIDIRSVKIDGKSINVNNYLSSGQLSMGNSATVDVTAPAELLFGDELPDGTSFTTGATQTYDNTNNLYNDYTNNTDQVFDMLGGRDVAYLGGGNDSVSGGAGNDIIRGGAGTDLLFGDAGDDRIYGGDDNDEIYGGDDNDRLHGDGGNDLLFGNDGADTLVGHTGTDTLVGGAGDDRLNGGADNDILYGGADNDRLAGGSGNDSLDGEAGADTLLGGSGDDILHGGIGNDALYGQTGIDILHGDDGDDDLFGGDDADELYGGDNSDLLSGGEGDDMLDGGSGNDTIYGEAGSDTISGGSGNDIIYGDQEIASLRNGLVAHYKFDETSGNTAFDSSGNGNDATFYGGTATWDSTGQLGGAWDMDGQNRGFEAGTFDVEGTGITLATWMYMDSIPVQDPRIITKTSASSAASHDWGLYINDNAGGIDRLQLRMTTVNGFSEEILEGYDMATHIGQWVHVAVTYDDTTDLVTYYINGASVGTDTHNAGGAVITGTGEAIGIGNNAQGISDRDSDARFDDLRIYERGLDATDISNLYNNVVTNGAADTIDGGAGDDIIYGSEGNDTINGGDDNDMLFGEDDRDNLIGGGGNDTLYGGAGDDDLLGGGDDDTLYGGGGNDTLSGQDGIDTIDGGDGNDTIFGDEGAINFESGILVIEAENYENTVIQGGHEWEVVTDTTASNGKTLYVDDNGGETIYNFADVTGLSPRVDYTVNFATTGTFYVWVRGRSGLSSGSAGQDDSVHVGFDGVQQTGVGGITGFGTNYTWGSNATGGGRVTVNVTTTGEHTLNLWMREDGVAIDKLIIADTSTYNPGSGLGPDQTNRTSTTGGIDTIDGGNGNDTIFGDFGADILGGGNGDDILYGGAADDTITGGDGLDIMYGDAGADTFVFENANAFNDIDEINDFSTGENDALDLRDLLTGYNFGVDTITDFVQILDNGSQSDVYVDTTGSATFGAATQIASLFNITGLTDEAALETSGHLITN